MKVTKGARAKKRAEYKQAKIDAAKRQTENDLRMKLTRQNDREALQQFVRMMGSCTLPERAICTAAHLGDNGAVQLFHTTIGDLKLFADSMRRVLNSSALPTA